MVRAHAAALLSALLLTPFSHALAQEADTGVGDTAAAMPGIAQVGLPVEGTPRLALALTGGYGFTEAQFDGDGAHHRLHGTAALSGRPLSWLSLYLRLDGRYDRHAEDAFGQDDGLAGSPRLGVRLSREVAEGLFLGGELSVFVPGGEAPSFAFDATSVDMSLLAAYDFGVEGLLLGALLGFRADQSSNAIRDVDSLRTGDRIALGLSDFHAVLTGLGLRYRLGALELLGELSWDLVVGDGAPGPLTSPLRLQGGVRYHLSEALQLEGMLRSSPSQRPDTSAGQPLVPIEARVAVTAGLRYAFHFGRKPATPKPVSTEPKATPVKPDAPDAPAPGSVAGVVQDAEGQPLAGARVVVVGHDPAIETTSDEAGRYTLQNVKPGKVQLRVEAEGYEPFTIEVEVSAGGSIETKTAQLTPKPPEGQIRGLVRSFSGKAVRARIRIEPSGAQVETDADGRFEIDVAPGKYEVIIQARGYVDQRRRVVVPKEGVTVLNADLRRGR
ncbi:MAG: carboxypeptidase regulatory-like domain-containing protein [Polyangiales bacterium]